MWTHMCARTYTQSILRLVHILFRAVLAFMEYPLVWQ